MSAKPLHNTATSQPSFRLSGHISIPGDKSISHRALILGALATGTTRIRGLLEGGDILATADAMRALGAKVIRVAAGEWTVEGVGRAGLRCPDAPLDFGNAGTGVRLGFGLVAGQNITAKFIGDDSLSKRPMARVLQPLEKMGATANSQNGCLPVQVTGTDNPQPSHHTLSVASAQVKSAILLAGLHAQGQTIIEEPVASRDHTENMLRAFGAKVQSTVLANGGRRVVLAGPAQLLGQEVTVPGDPSSAAFAIIAALIVPGSQITINNVMINPTRNGLVLCLQQSGYQVELLNQRLSGGEDVADIRVQFGGSFTLCPSPEQAVTMIDEYPAAMVLAAFAQGTSRFSGIGELRVKESDRIEKMAQLLRRSGVVVRTGEDWMEVDGLGSVFGAMRPHCHREAFAVAGDHRIAMSAMVLGLGGFLPVGIDDASVIDTSYPDFFEDMQKLGAHMTLGRQSTPAIVIAVDGPSASGKGTLARLLAAQLNLPYLDTGLLYRATARAALDANTDLHDNETIARMARELELPITAPEQLRSAEIGAAASKVAAIPEVRDALLEVQRAFANGKDGAVLDGRDIGTIICPDADVKLWITASDHVRAERRRTELSQAGQHVTEKEMLAQLCERDARDASRGAAPMKKADDAYLIDTSNLAIDAALQIARQRVERHLAERR